MTPKKAKITATIVVSVLSTVIRRYFQMRQFHRGRDGFLAWEAHYYDTVLTKHSLVEVFIIALFGTALIFVVYEYLVRWLTTRAAEANP